MFFSIKNNLVDKSEALSGRNDPIVKELSHEINGYNLMDIPKDFKMWRSVRLKAFLTR